MSPVSLVTGGAGFLGSHVAEELLRSGHEVIVLDDLSGGYEENVPRGARFYCGSVTSSAVVEALFATERIDYVFHLAAYAAEGLSHYIRRYNYTNNILGSVTLINEAVRHGVKCFVFTSSVAVYGAHGRLAVTEGSPLLPIDPYGIAKLAVEQDLAAARRLFGMDSIVFRPHNVYGEHQNIWDRYRNVVGIFMRQALGGEPITVFGDGEQERAFSYVGDVAPLIARSVEDSRVYNRVFNVGSGEPITVNELAEAVMGTLGVRVPVTHMPERDEVKYIYASHEEVRAAFGEREEVPLRDGLERMAAWAASVEPRESQRPCEIEIRAGLPPAWSEEPARRAQ
jgi:UDP-glucose 4-epimerase